MFSFANNNCEEPSLKAESTSLKSKVSCSGKMQLLHTTASFETVAYWAVQSFMLGRAVSITTDWLCKSLGRHHKKKAERGREGAKDSNKTSPISVCDNMRGGRWKPPPVENTTYLTSCPPKPPKDFKDNTYGGNCWREDEGWGRTCFVQVGNALMEEEGGWMGVQ